MRVKRIAFSVISNHGKKLRMPKTCALCSHNRSRICCSTLHICSSSRFCRNWSVSISSSCLKNLCEKIENKLTLKIVVTYYILMQCVQCVRLKFESNQIFCKYLEPIDKWYFLYIQKIRKKHISSFAKLYETNCKNNQFFWPSKVTKTYIFIGPCVSL